MNNVDRLMDACTMQDHWLSFDINPMNGTYRIGNKTFRSVQKATDELNRLLDQRAGWAQPRRAA